MRCNLSSVQTLSLGQAQLGLQPTALLGWGPHASAFLEAHHQLAHPLQMVAKPQILLVATREMQKMSQHRILQNRTQPLPVLLDHGTRRRVVPLKLRFSLQSAYWQNWT